MSNLINPFTAIVQNGNFFARDKHIKMFSELRISDIIRNNFVNKVKIVMNSLEK